MNPLDHQTHHVATLTSHLANGPWQPPASLDLQHLSVQTEPGRRVQAANDTDLLHDTDEPIEDSDCDSPDTASSVRGDANYRLRRIVGPRLHKAREFAGFTQTEAAQRFGYKTSAQLSLWEMSRRSAPTTELVKAARVYGCSVDWLVGESDEIDRDHSAGLRHACLRGVRTMLSRVAEVTVDEVARHAKLVGPHAAQVRDVVAAGESLLDGFQDFQRHNVAVFDDQRGSATLVRLADEFEDALQSARTAIRLHDALDGDLRRALAAIDDSDHVLPSVE